MEKQIVFDFVEAINRGDVGELYKLMADDYLFIDAHDNRIYGRDDMQISWAAYFDMFPDYLIEVQEIFEKEHAFCLLGYASGTYKNLKNPENSNYWRIPAAWKAVVENKQIKHWQVYADNIHVMDIINRVENEV